MTHCEHWYGDGSTPWLLLLVTFDQDFERFEGLSCILLS
ncbi:hypothetical protein Mcate_02173 [Meiothermus taiwanensis]|uniref:Uncharacterized protein n=1 Tax=Meiothermus taiwanensis TaxID=172827 RepID=A0A399E034_9DEIN|nr:hypothetical protein Mcate_02173 [Meiothermus taiwanensis]